MPPSGPRADGSVVVDGPYLQALALAALGHMGLENREPEMRSALRHPSNQMVDGESVKLTRLFNLLTGEMSLPLMVAGKVLLLMALHLDSSTQVSVDLSKEARIAMKLALATFQDLEGVLSRLARDVQQRLRG